MTFATQILKNDSRRFMLVEITGKRRAVNGTSLGGNLYEFDIGSGLFVDSVLVDGVSKTFTYSGSTLTVTSLTSILSTSIYVVVYHKLYLTGTQAVVSSGVSGMPDAMWEPRLSQFPTVTQSMRNIADGVFSLSGSSIKVISHDGYIQSLSGLNDSFSDGSVRVWLCVNSVNDNKIIFHGRISSYSISSGVATFEVIDEFLKLKDSANYGTADQGLIQSGGSICEFPETKYVGQQASMVLGFSSKYKLAQGYLGNGVTYEGYKTYHVTDGIDLIKDTPEAVAVTTTSAKYFVAKFIGSDLKKMTFGTVTRTYRKFSSFAFHDFSGNQVYGLEYFYHIKCSNFSGMVGDCIPTGVNGTDPVYVCYVGTHTGPDSQTYDFICKTQTGYWTTGSPAPDGLVTNPSLPDNTYFSFCVYRSNVKSFNLNYGYNDGWNIYSTDTIYYIHYYNAAVEPFLVSLGTIGGQTVSALYIDINYNDVINGTYNYFEISESKVFDDLQCRFSPLNSMTHGEAIDFVVQSSGLSVNSASITQADADLDAEVSVTFPIQKSGENEKYLDHAQYICKSSFSLLSLNPDREVEYQVIKDLTALDADHSRSNTDIIVDSHNAKCQYFDIVSQIYFENPQYFEEQSIANTGPVASVSNSQAKYLHGAEKTMTYKHCLTTIQGRKDLISGYLGSSNVQYSLATASNDLNSSIGDIVEVSAKSVMSGTQTAKAIITQIENSSGSSTVTLQEIRGV